jgi:tRNA threonylcarbamoyladenosine biosynthesis protein TsaB
MLILAIDGAMARCSAAVWADGVILAEALQDGARGHPAVLPPMVQDVLARAGIAPTRLDAVAAVVGPGGFTGLRAALALAEGIALASGCPAIGVTTGEALAASLPAARRAGRAVWSALDGRRGRLLLEIIPAGGLAAEAPPLMLAETALPRPAGPVAVVGDAAAPAAARLAARGADAVLTDLRLPVAADIPPVAAARLRGTIPPLGLAALYGEPPAVRRPGG